MVGGRKRNNVLNQLVRAVTAGAQRENRVLAERHRVILGGWPIAGAVAVNDRRVATLADLLDHVVEAGYDGVELGVQGFEGFFPPNAHVETVIRTVRAEASQRGVQICGDLFIVSDSEATPVSNHSALDFADPDLEAKLTQRLRHNAALGCEYATFQISLPERHMHTGGEFRNDDSFLSVCAERIAMLQTICHNMGQNFYVETHVDRISEDIEAFTRIMGRGPAFEVTADLSHYIHRGITAGTGLEMVLSRVGHMHQRMAQTHGDLSADVSDPVVDWQDPNGATRQAWDMAKRALRGGLSSRCIMGETGPMNNVAGTRTLDLDASLVPLYRLMANYADEEVSAINPFAPAASKTLAYRAVPESNTALVAVDRFVDPGVPPEDPSIKLLWPRGAVPGSNDANGSEIELISQVSTPAAQEALSGLIGFAFERWPASFLWRGPHVPAIKVFEPASELKTGAAMIIAPGGGYSILPPHEGDAVAEWLADHGVTAILLRHRLIPYGYPIPTPAGDMQRAIRYVRHHAADLEVDPHRVGVLGISAGGHCASSAATMFGTDVFPPTDAIDTESCRPDLCVLVYPLTNPGEFRGWVDKKAASFGSDHADIKAQNTAMLVTTDTPPTFIAHSTGDASLRVADHADPYWAALQANGVDSEYVRTDFGAHGCGLVEAWGAPCIEWLASRQFVSPQASSEYVYDFFGGDEFFDAVAAAAPAATAVVSAVVQKQPVDTVKRSSDAALVAVDRFVDPGVPPEDPSIKLLWPRGAVPGSNDANGSEIELISQVSTPAAQEALSGLIGFAFERWPASFLWRGPHVPAIKVFEPASELKTGAAMIIAPGGGYSILPPHEGDAVAEWLADHGVTAILLRHRLIPYGYPIPTPAGDMQRAIRYVRHHAADLEVDPHRVGVLGISAGGHCASSAATMFGTDVFPPTDAIDTESCRPDLCVLVYPLTNPGEFRGWVDKKAASFGSDHADIKAQNTAMLVTTDTPPTFIAHSTGDASLRVADHADPYWAALQANGVDSEYVRTDFGAHGCGLVEAWGAPCIEWLASRQFVSPQASSEYVYDFFGGDEFFDAVATQ